MKLKKIKPVYLGAVLSVAFVCVAIAAQAGNAGQVDNSAFLPVNSEIDSINDNVKEVTNIIENMQNGDITAGQAKDEIQWKLQFAKNNCDCSPEDMKVNKLYIDFLEAAKDVTKAKMNGASDMDAKITIMNELKNKLN